MEPTTRLSILHFKKKELNELNELNNLNTKFINNIIKNKSLINCNILVFIVFNKGGYYQRLKTINKIDNKNNVQNLIDHNNKFNLKINEIIDIFNGNIVKNFHIITIPFEHRSINSHFFYKDTSEQIIRYINEFLEKNVLNNKNNVSSVLNNIITNIETHP